MLKVLGRVDHFEPECSDALQSYLRRAVVNRINDEFRRADRRPLVSTLDDRRHSASSEESPLDAAIGSETAALYVAALERLSSDEQQAVVARVELSYSYEQIALLLDKRTADAARLAVSRALLRLAEEMGRGR